MKSDLQAEFSRFAKQAQEALREVPESGSYTRVFTFWEFPSFENPYVWTLYSPHKYKSNLSPFATYSVWRSDLDSAKFESPLERLKYPLSFAPTIDTETIQLSSKEVDAAENSLRDVQVPLYVDRAGFGLDGTIYEFTYGRTMIAMTLIWWENQPVEWIPFTSRILELVESLNKKRK